MAIRIMWMREHDTLAKRLGLILTRLNTGERLALDNLSREFNVSERTLQRDFNERLNYLPIEREGGTYYLNPKYLGNRSKADIKPILDKLGLSRLFPSFDALSFTQLVENETTPFLFRDIKVEDVSTYQDTFNQLTLAIQRNRKVHFSYKQRQYQNAMPYKLVNDRGWWYLAAVHHHSLKTFKVANVKGVEVLNHSFLVDTKITGQLLRDNLLWLTDNPIEVVVKVDPSVAVHFRNNTLLPEQQLIKVLDDGSLLITSTITDKKQILPILKYWLPDIEILSPSELKQSLVHELQFSIEQLMK